MNELRKLIKLLNSKNSKGLENSKNFQSKGESRNVEFKESLSLKDEIGENVSAFSNTKKGFILVGLTDSGEIKGVQIGKKTIENLANYIKQHTDNHIYPIIDIKIIDGKEIVIIEINEKSEKPVFFKGKAYKRIGKSVHKLSASEIRELVKKSTKTYWDRQICEDGNLKDIDEEKVKKYLKYREKYRNVSREIKISINQFLENIKAVKNKKPTNAGILFFSKYPQKFMANARLRVVKFKGIDVIHPTLDTANCDGTIWEIIDIAEDFIRKNIRLFGTRTEKSFQREDKFEYPIKALREAMINALIHRNYSETGDVRVFIFDDRVEIINPGTFPNGVTPKKPKHKPVNEILSQLVYDVGLIEKYGSGIKMMNELSKKWGNKEPYYKLHPIETKIIFESQIKESTYVEEDVLEGLNDRQRKAVEYIKEKKIITNREYRKINSVSNRIAFEELSNLIGAGIIVKKGEGRSIYYVFR